MNWQEQIDEIMDCFDFEKVQKVMQHMDWKWGSLTPAQVPGTYKLKQTARGHLKTLAAIESVDDIAYVGSGGFTAYRFGNIQLRLAFELDSWESEQTETNDKPEATTQNS